MILEEKCPACEPPEGEIHCCPVWGLRNPDAPSDCCANCRCARVVLTEEGRQVLDLVRRHMEVTTFSGGGYARGSLVEKRR